MGITGTNITMLLSTSSSLFLLRSPDEGATWGYPEYIPGTESAYAAVPLDMVTTHSGKIYMVYLKKTATSGEMGGIYFLHSQ
jgi:hypothetical protein